MSGLVKGSVAVVGAAESDLGQVASGSSPLDLMAQATIRALDDCGLTLKDVDGLFVAATQVRMGPMALAEYLRIKPKYFDGTICHRAIPTFMVQCGDPTATGSGGPGTGWLDCYTPFNQAIATNNDYSSGGAYLNGTRAIGSSTWNLTIGNGRATFNSDGYVVIRITVGSNWTGSIDNMSLAWF
jgi:hypothetical protein